MAKTYEDGIADARDAIIRNLHDKISLEMKVKQHSTDINAKLLAPIRMAVLLNFCDELKTTYPEDYANVVDNPIPVV